MSFRGGDRRRGRGRGPTDSFRPHYDFKRGPRDREGERREVFRGREREQQQPDRRAAQVARIDREKTCPLLVRVFPQLNKHHKPSEYQGSLPDEEVQIYTWKDATLRDMSDLVKQVREEARLPDSRLSFGFVSPGPIGEMTLREVGIVHAIKRSRDDQKTLGELRFITGDYLDVAIKTGPEEEDSKMEDHKPDSIEGEKEQRDTKEYREGREGKEGKDLKESIGRDGVGKEGRGEGRDGRGEGREGRRREPMGRDGIGRGEEKERREGAGRERGEPTGREGREGAGREGKDGEGKKLKTEKN